MDNAPTPITTPHYDPVLRLEPAAEYIGSKGKARLYKLFRSGELKMTRLGQRTSGVRLSELERWIAAQQDKGPPPNTLKAGEKGRKAMAEKRSAKNESDLE